ASTKKPSTTAKKVAPAKKTAPAAKKAAPVPKKAAPAPNKPPAKNPAAPAKKVAEKPAKKPAATRFSANGVTARSTFAPKPKPAPVRPKTGPYAKDTKFLEEVRDLLMADRAIYQEQATSLRA